MAMSDCIMCWDTPCTCGWGYRNYSKERLANIIARITQYRSKEEAASILDEAIQVVKRMDNWYDKSRIN
jgi:hypothetical protein